MTSKKDFIFDILSSWRTDRPDDPFASELEYLTNRLPTEIARLRLKQIRAWLALCESKKTALEREYPYLQNLYSPAFERPEQQEYALCELFIPRLRLEVARRGREGEPKHVRTKVRVRQSVKRDAFGPATSNFQHSNDYRSVVFGGQQHTLTSQQAHVVKMLHQAYSSGTPDLGKDYILEELETPASRLRDTFKSSRLWGTLIVTGTKRGTYRLNLNDLPKEPPKSI